LSADTAILGAPLEFVLFALTLLGIAVFHRHTLRVALAGLSAIAVYKLTIAGFDQGHSLIGLGLHLRGELVTLANLALILTGFAILSRHFERSRLPEVTPLYLPEGWQGGLTLLALVFILSGLLDNIAGALIGATIAQHVYKSRVHIGFLAAIVAASNAGGAGSVVGDTTTTMMWIAGKSPLEVMHAYVGAIACVAVFAIPAALAQHKHQPAARPTGGKPRVDWMRVGIVAFILVAAVSANVIATIFAPTFSDHFPVIGVAVWGAILLAAPIRHTEWSALNEAGKGTLFLVALVLAASLMPVEALPAASWQSAFSLGLISAVFDNIPLTALALDQGNYDWGLLAYAVGFGGSMTWFGSSAGVAVSNIFPQARSVVAWSRAAWWLPAAYIVGFLVMLGTLGWHPTP